MVKLPKFRLPTIREPYTSLGASVLVEPANPNTGKVFFNAPNRICYSFEMKREELEKLASDIQRALKLAPPNKKRS